MFDSVREQKRVIQVILGAIVLSFAFWGVDSYQQSGETVQPASVEGSDISQQELDEAMRQQKEMMKQRFGAEMDVSMFDTPEMRNNLLQGLIAQRALLVHAQKIGLAVTDQQVQNVIQQIELFQKEGLFDHDLYVAELASRNMTPVSFEMRMRQDLVSEQLRNTLLQSAPVSDKVLDRIIQLNERKWQVAVADFPFMSYMAEMNITPEQIKEYYEKNPVEFKALEQAKVAYVVLSRESLQKDIEVSEQEIAEYYEGHKGDFGAQEQRQASHILIGVDASASEADQAKVKQKAEEVLAKVKASPDQFAELAKQFSEDPGSAELGGDLGFFEPGMMVKAFDEVVFSLQKGEMSDLVKTDFGYHIIKLEDINPATTVPLAEVAEQIKTRLRQQKVADVFAEKAENFSNAVYEQGDNLEAAAEIAGVKVAQSDWVMKNRPMGGVWTPKLLQAIFTDEVIKDKRNTSVVEVGEDTLVAARMLEHKPEMTRPLSEVEELVRQKLKQYEAVKKAVANGEAELAKLKTGEGATVTWAASKEVTRAQTDGLDQELAQKIFQLKSDAKLPAFIGMEMPGIGYNIVKVEAIHNGQQADAEKKSRYAEQLRQMAGEQLIMAYIEDIKSKMDIKLKAVTEE